MPSVPRARERSLVAALLAVLAFLLLAGAPAQASVSSTTDPYDAYDGQNDDPSDFTQSFDVRKVTWDSDTQAGKVLLSFEIVYRAPTDAQPDGTPFDGAVFIDTNRD